MSFVAFLLAVVASPQLVQPLPLTYQTLLLAPVVPFVDPGPPPTRPVALMLSRPTIDDMMPVAAKAMLAAAQESGNEQEMAIVVKYAARAWPFFDRHIRRQEQNWRQARVRAREQTLRQAGFLDLWDGRGEVGGFLTTGNTENVGVSAALNLGREGLNWRHRLYGNADYQESFGRTSRERYVAGYEPNYKFDDRLFAYGAMQFESDRFLGYDERLSASAGVGYGVVRAANVRLDLTAGPAYRYTDFTDHATESTFGGRGSLDFSWRLSSGVRVTQVASAYLQSRNSTVTATSALEARLLGPLSARLSYNVQYESDPTARRVSTDTITRASLVYDF